MFWILQWRGFRVNYMLTHADVRISQNIQTFGVSCHQPILDAIMDHFDEVSGTVRSTMQKPLIGCTGKVFGAAFSDRQVTFARCESGKNGREMLNGGFFAADHETIAALQAEYAAAGSHINIVETF